MYLVNKKTIREGFYDFIRRYLKSTGGLEQYYITWGPIEDLRFHESQLRHTTKTLCLPHKIPVALWKVQSVIKPQVWHYSWDNMIQLLYGIPKAISFTNLFCNIFDISYHYIPSLNQKLAQLIPLTIIQVSTRTFSSGSALYIHFRDKELLKKIFGVPMMTQYEVWVPGFFCCRQRCIGIQI